MVQQPPSGTYLATRAVPDEGELRGQVAHALAQGWTCAIEHVDPLRATQTYWQMWKLPLFGASDPDEVLDELSSCRAAHPDDRIRLLGYDERQQTQGLSIVVQRGRRP